MTETLAVDLAIIGAGPVGMALAAALRGSGLRIALLDRRPRGAWIDDPRALAIAYGGRQLLDRLGAWRDSDASDIRRIHVSQQHGFGSTRIDAGDYRLPALGYVVRYRDLAARLDLNLGEAHFLAPANVESLVEHGDALRLRVSHRGDTLKLDARLVVHAEGTPDAAAPCWTHDYRQQAIVAEVTPASAHRGEAWERFTPDGPLALLPLGGDLAVVLTAPAEAAARLMQLDDAEFLATLREKLGRRLDFRASGPRAAFPLALRLRRDIVGRREAWLGNTAQTLHPVTGQGFNLGLRDAWTLAETLLHGGRRDPGSAELLAAYARRRRADRLAGAALTDGLVRLFANDLAPLRALRGAGLAALDLVPPLRHAIARQMIWGARPH